MDNKLMISDLLPTGKENAISMRDLAKILNCDERCIRAAVLRERLLSIPICSNDDGYYIGESVSDLQDCMAEFKKRNTTTEMVIKTFDQMIEQWGNKEK